MAVGTPRMRAPSTCVRSSGWRQFVVRIALGCPRSNGRRGLGARRSARCRWLRLRSTEEAPRLRSRLDPGIREGRRESVGRRRGTRRAPNCQGVLLYSNLKTNSKSLFLWGPTLCDCKRSFGSRRGIIYRCLSHNFCRNSKYVSLNILVLKFLTIKY